MIIVTSNAKVKSFLGFKWISVSEVCVSDEGIKGFVSFDGKKPVIDLLKKHRDNTEYVWCDTVETEMLLREIGFSNIANYDSIKSAFSAVNVADRYKEKNGFRGEIIVEFIDDGKVYGAVATDPDNVSQIGKKIVSSISEIEVVKRVVFPMNFDIPHTLRENVLNRNDQLKDLWIKMVLRTSI